MRPLPVIDGTVWCATRAASSATEPSCRHPGGTCGAQGWKATAPPAGVPSLRGLAGRMRRWLAVPATATRPAPGFGESMPRLALARKPPPSRHAHVGAAVDAPVRAAMPPATRAARDQGVRRCHGYTGARAHGKARRRGRRRGAQHQLAPGFTRSRQPATVDACWRPARRQADAAMPDRAHRRRAPSARRHLRPLCPLTPAHEPPPRLPLLSRKVRFAECNRRAAKSLHPLPPTTRATSASAAPARAASACRHRSWS